MTTEEIPKWFKGGLTFRKKKDPKLYTVLTYNLKQNISVINVTDKEGREWEELKDLVVLISLFEESEYYIVEKESGYILDIGLNHSKISQALDKDNEVSKLFLLEKMHIIESIISCKTNKELRNYVGELNQIYLVPNSTKAIQSY